MKAIILTSVLVIMASLSGMSQTLTDTQNGLTYDIYDVVLEWDDWKQNPTAANAFIGDFIEEFDIPKKGKDGLNRQETWYNWMSNHPALMDEYLMRRSQNSAGN